MNRALVYMAGIFTAGCAMISLNRNNTATLTNKEYPSYNIVKKDGTLVEYGHIRNRAPLNITRVQRPKTYAFVQKNTIKTIHL